jgi:hypothetical protein
MERYLALLTNEFQASYKKISDAQRVHEARVEKLLAAVDESTTLPEDEPWAVIRGLRGLSDFVDGPGYRRDFVDQLDEASRLLRRELREWLGATSHSDVTSSG